MTIEKPNYYQSTSIDVIDLCKLYDINFNKGNVIKYVCRAGKKDNEIQDLKKAVEYLQREIEHLKNQQ